MELIASGRDSDVFAHADGQVLRRYRDGRSAEAEAATIRSVASLDYPVPTVFAADGPDMVMQRVQGPTLAEAVVAGLSPRNAGATLAMLHDRLHALPWPAAAPGECLLHLDLHPLNVIVSGAGPVVIDWSNAGPGPAGLDVAMTAVILAQVLVTDSLLASVGLPGEAGLRSAIDGLLRSFAANVGTAYLDDLPAAARLRGEDRYLTATERADLPRAVELSRSAALI